MNKLCYIISGTSYMGLNSWYVKDNDRLKSLVKMSLDKLAKQSKHHEFGLLYNAYTERNFPEVLRPYYSHVKEIHSDSGGLQMSSRGIEMTPEVELEIYKNQYTNSHIAMSIDDIPIEIFGDVGQARAVMTNKKFIISRNKQAGINSGKNLNRQIQTFKSLPDPYDMDCKPLMVIQGNSLEDYHVYFNAMLSQIPQEDYKYIGGYALAGSSIGIGELESLDSLFAFLELDKPKEIPKKLHLLGYGSVSRLMPVLSIINTLLKDYHITYDSTSHVSLYVFGNIMRENCRVVKLGQKPNPVGKAALESMYDVFAYEIQTTLDASKEEWVETELNDLVGSEKYHVSERKRDLHGSVKILCALYSILNFVNFTDRVLEDLSVYGTERSKIYQYIRDHCTNHTAWYGKYRQQLSRYLESNRIERVEGDVSVVSLF